VKLFDSKKVDADDESCVELMRVRSSPIINDAHKLRVIESFDPLSEQSLSTEIAVDEDREYAVGLLSACMRFDGQGDNN
jgi:hypothetical protein